MLTSVRIHPARRVAALSGAALVVLALALATTTSAQDAKPKAPQPGGEAPYVDSKTIKERFKDVSAEDMELLRGKKILFASRSFGLNLCNGFRQLAAEDKKYEFLSSYQRYDVFKAGGDLSIIPADAYAQKNFVHFLASYWPHTLRVEEVDNLMRKKPHEFGQTVDFVIIFFHIALPKNFEQYAAKMDALVKDFPNTRFIYVTAGLMDAKMAKDNEPAHEWSELVRARYKGKAPLYDLGKILSDDFRCGHAYCPEYSKDPNGIHPNLPAGESMMAKGMLLVLRDTIKWKPLPEKKDAAKASPAATPPTPAGDAAKTPTAPEVKTEAVAPDHPDYKAVRAILDANGLKAKKVENVSVVENGRIVKLYLQEGGIKELPEAVGQLTELRVLHVYGDRSLPHPLLEKISPAIGKCVKLEELLLNSNELKALPAEIAQLTKIERLSLADNRLANLPEAVAAWAKKFDAKGLEAQRP